MTTDVFPFFGTIQQLWSLLCSEYDRLHKTLGREPFFFEQPDHSIFREYTPKDGDEIYVEFRDPGTRDNLVTLEFEPKAGDSVRFTVFLHAHGNAFQEPHKSAIQIWKQIEESMRARGHLFDPKMAHFENNRRRKQREETGRKIGKLREYRQQQLDQTGEVPNITKAMSLIGITHGTVKAHAEGLIKNWKDREYE